MLWNKSLLCLLINIVLCESFCIKEPLRKFHLIKRCQRSKQNMIEFENVASLEECFKVAESAKALALNYSPLRGLKSNLFQQDEDSNSKLNFTRRNKRRHFFDQPEEFFNCHALQCPESSDFVTMVNDSRYDYYSLFGNPPGANFSCLRNAFIIFITAPDQYICQPEIGLFQVNLTEEKYETAYKLCKKNSNGTLAHIVSEKRTNALSKLLQGSDFSNGTLQLAYVGLNFTLNYGTGVFMTPENEELSCFLFRAWGPGHPKTKGSFSNSSCVAITTDITWMTIDCDQKLPYICEIYTSPLNESLFLDACDTFLNN